MYQDFKKLFTKRETQEIQGRKNKSTLILTSMLFVTFIAIGFAFGGIEFLSLKMNDPFVQHLEIGIPYSKAENVETYMWHLNQDSLYTRFDYDTVLSHTEYPLIFWNNVRKDYRKAKGRSIGLGNPLLKQILGNNNLIAGRNYRGNQDYGLIVTEKFLKDFGYKRDELFLKNAVAREDEGYYLVPIPIIAVVKELPGLCSFAYTPYFYQSRTSGIDNPFNIRDYRDLVIFLPLENPNKQNVAKKDLINFFKAHQEYQDIDPDIILTNNFDTYLNGINLRITFYPEPETLEEINEIYAAIKNSVQFKKYNTIMTRYYQYEFEMFPRGNIAYDKMSINFRSLDKVKEFKEYLFDNFELEVEMSKIKDKENFKTISILTLAIATLLLVFSVLSVGLFIFNLLKSHLEKVKMNIGTFKAFGLSNSVLKNIYKSIIRKFLFQALLISYLFALIIDIIVVAGFFKELSFTHLLNIYVFAGVLLIWKIVDWIYKITSAGLLKSTPGDLIYGRDIN